MTAISVITICFNNLQEMITTCNSVDIQAELPFEHIIIDGSTKPDIKNYLQQNHQPAYRNWISENDNGIADAFNKGINKSKGDIVVMLNAGDSFYNEYAIGTVTKLFNENPAIKWLHGKYQLHRGNQMVIIGKPFEKGKLYRGMRSVCHQSMFVKKELHQQYGMYDVSEKIGMDYDFLCRIANEKFLFTDKV
ncbi:MAG TPA: glycosyltransferase, partial [Ferruginibacter sp.]|nr:glycosyltransferase [Ferruginibacter sp.]